MAWKGRDREILPDLKSLLNSLNNSKLSSTNNALYQTIYGLITRTQTVRDTVTTKLIQQADVIIDIGNTIINNDNKVKNATFLSVNNETLNFPSSVQELPGDAIEFDDTVPNQRTVNVLVDGITVTINGFNQLVATAGGIQSVDVVLTDADILALPTTPFTLVPAAGANTYIQFITAFNYLNLSAGAYTNIDPGGWGRLVVGVDVSNYIGDVTTSGLSGTLDFLLSSAAIRQFAFVPLQEPAIVSPSWWSGVWIPSVDASLNLNQPLVLDIDNNGAGNFTGGNAANTWKMTIVYKVVNV